MTVDYAIVRKVISTQTGFNSRLPPDLRMKDGYSISGWILSAYLVVQTSAGNINVGLMYHKLNARMLAPFAVIRDEQLF